jgi:glycosyltransferase involved in cell wall biosynthesis
MKKIPEDMEILKNTAFISTFFNEAGTVSGLLESLFTQDCLPSEVVLVDGGSTDGTPGKIINFLKTICPVYQEYPGTGFHVSQEDSGRKRTVNGKIHEKNSTCTGSVTDPDHIFEGEILKKVKVKLYIAKNATISQGRNLAIKKTGADLICASDGGCILADNWLSEITGDSLKESGSGTDPALRRKPDKQEGPEIGLESVGRKRIVTGGYSAPVTDTFIKACLSACMMPVADEVNPVKFMPSSRNISFTKQAWQDAGMYPENLDFGEDMKFNFNLLKNGCRIHFNPEAVVYWNMRNSLVSIFKQFFRYAKGDALGRMYPVRHAVRFAALFLFAGILALSIFISPFFPLSFVPLFILYTFRPYKRLKHVLNGYLRRKHSVPDKKITVSPGHRTYLMECLKLIICIPLLLVYIDIAKASGFLYGIVHYGNRSFRVKNFF